MADLLRVFSPVGHFNAARHGVVPRQWVNGTLFGFSGLVPLQHLRQLRTLRTASIIHVVGNLLRAFGCKFTEPIGDLGIAATLLNETIQPVIAVTPAFLTTHAKHIELAGEIAKDSATVAGHFDVPGSIIGGCVG
jgi:hypothetical protein